VQSVALSPLTLLLVSIAAALLLPLLLVGPAHLRGRARDRAGLAAGWTGPGWQLWHVWLAFAFLIAAELSLFYALQPETFVRIFGRSDAEPAFGSVESIMNEDASRELLWSAIAVSATLVLVLPFAPLRMLWTRHWSVRKAIGAGALAFVILRLVTLLLAPALPSFGSEEHPQHELTESFGVLTSEHSVWLTVAVAALLAPIAEEVLFRGVALTGLARRISFGWANAIQAALFATLHLSATLFPVFFLMGLMAGELMRRSGGLLAPIALHALNNGAAVFALWNLMRAG
jgi:uncharacterized protein